MRHSLCLMLAVVAALLGTNPVLAADADNDTKNKKKSPFSIEFSAGAEYDSNVAVLELDRSSGESDLAAVVDLGLGFRPDTGKLKLDLGYDFSQTLHEQFDEFDLRIHRGSAGLGYDFGRVDAGVTVQVAEAELAGEPYLTFKQATPSLSRMFGKRLFVRLAWARTEKEFRTSPGRDATSDTPSVDTFLFLDGRSSYLVFGFRQRDEDAADDAFDYTGGGLKLQWTRRFETGSGREVSLKAALRSETRDYDGALLPAGQPRRDERQRFDLELELPLSNRGFVRARYEYADNRSNLSSVDFREHVASIGFGAKL